MNCRLKLHERSQLLIGTHNETLAIAAIAGAGVTVERNFDFFRADQSKRTDPAPYVRVAAEVKF